MDIRLTASAQRVQDALVAMGHGAISVIELAESTRTAQQAADALQCDVGQIVKSLIFMVKESQQPILLLVSGSNKVDEKHIAQIVGGKIERAHPDFVRQVTGFAIGGIPPVGHVQAIPTYIDKDLLQYTSVWAAAGTPHAVFSMPVSVLQKLSIQDHIISMS